MTLNPGRTRITPFLWFDTQAEEAASFYISVFPNSRILNVLRTTEAGPGPAGRVLTVAFELDGVPFTALNGGPNFHFTEAVSFVVWCDDQEEIDRYWDALTRDGGKPVQCGWLKDRYGLSWQVTPKAIPELINSPAAMRAMMGMVKLDIAALKDAAGA